MIVDDHGAIAAGSADGDRPERTSCSAGSPAMVRVVVQGARRREAAHHREDGRPCIARVQATYANVERAARTKNELAARALDDAVITLAELNGP